MRCTAHLALIALATAATPPARAQEKILPGLWEHTFSMKSESGRMEALQQQMQTQMAALPPAQRQQMEALMAQRGVAIGPKGNTFKVCISKEDADADRLPQNDERCQQQTLLVQHRAAGQRRGSVHRGEPEGLHRQQHREHCRAGPARADAGQHQRAVDRHRLRHADAASALSGSVATPVARHRA